MQVDLGVEPSRIKISGFNKSIMEKKKIIVKEKVFNEDCILQINHSKYYLRFIDIGNNAYTIELENLDNSKEFKIIGEWRNGKIESLNGELFHAEVISI